MVTKRRALAVTLLHIVAINLICWLVISNDWEVEDGYCDNDEICDTFIPQSAGAVLGH